MSRFPKDCWDKNCEHFHVTDMSVDDLLCACDMLGYELALIGQQHKIGSDDYKEATKRFFGNDLDMVLAERDGGSRNYYLKNGMYVHHHIPGMIDKNSEIYGSVTFRRDEWKVKVVIGRDGAFLGEDNITRDGSYSR